MKVWFLHYMLCRGILNDAEYFYERLVLLAYDTITDSRGL